MPRAEEITLSDTQVNLAVDEDKEYADWYGHVLVLAYHPCAENLSLKLAKLYIG